MTVAQQKPGSGTGRKDRDAGSRRFKVAISGSYGGMNIGDEAILEAIISELRGVAPVEITVFTRDAEDTKRRHNVDHVVQIRDLSRDEAREQVERLDVLVLGGGGLLYDKDAEAYLREVGLAHECGVPVMVYAISAGPLEDPRAREVVRDRLTRAAVVSVRDRRGLHLLEEVGIDREIELTADPALLLEPEAPPDSVLKREGRLKGKRPLVGFSVREPGPAAPDMDVGHYHALLANAADFMVDRLNADIVFVPMERSKMDLQHSHAVIASMQCADRATVLKGEYSPRQLLGLVGRLEFVVGMRLHLLIFAALQGVPFVALPYAPKVLGLITDLEMEMPPLSGVTTGRLIANIDHSWDSRHHIRRRLRRRVPMLKERARRTNQLLVQLLHETRSQGRAPGG